MQMSKDIGQWMQQILIGLNDEDSGMIYFILGNLNWPPLYTVARWQLGADTVYRTVVCGLVDVNDYGAFPNRSSFFEGIRTLNPNDSSGEGFWHATLVWGTERLSELIDKFFPSRDSRDNELSPPFIEALEQIFADNGVPWSEQPLLPVTPAHTAPQ
jgi:hypothetical protein